MNALLEFLQSLVQSVAVEAHQAGVLPEPFCEPGLHIRTSRVRHDFTIVTLYNGQLSSHFDRRDSDRMTWWRPAPDGIEFVADLSPKPEAVAA